MNRKLTWLHISDIHFHPGTGWRDNAARAALLEYLSRVYEADESLRPDLIFCTGDIAFGETGSAPLADQYEQARSFFDSLLKVCGRGGAPLPKERLFVVPGNHDVNRKSINSYAQATMTGWARQPAKHAANINQHFNDRATEFTDAVKRLNEYANFVQSYLPHQSDAEGRHCYARVVDIDGLKVAVAGFNSAWSCAGPEDDRTLWMAAECQFNSVLPQLKDVDVRVGLIHHPVDWLNEADRDVATRRIAGGFHFWLHGHTHNPWVEPGQRHVTIAAGAVGAEKSEEFGVNIVSLDPAASKGIVRLHAYSTRDGDWATATVPKHAPEGRWPFDLPPELQTHTEEPAAPPEPPPPDKRTTGLFGREVLLKETEAKLQCHPFLLVYGLRGNGKSALIEALGQAAPLAGLGAPVRYSANPSTTADELFRQFATLLGDTSEFPKAPSGKVEAIATEVRRRYQNPRPTWVWIEHAHHLLDNEGFFTPEVRSLLLGLQSALGMLWRWVFEFRERPAQGLFDAGAAQCEVPGLDRASLAECLAHGAPHGREAEWRYGGSELKGIYQWLGAGHGKQAHPLAIQLLIDVARGHKETPLETLKRHRGDFEQKLEERLLDDLYNQVLSAPERRMLQALALYRYAIPHDHADTLERHLKVPGAWDGLDRRCLLSSNADHSQYYLHSFIAGWLRTGLGYAGHGEDAEADFAEEVDYHRRQQARDLHAAVAACWLDQLSGSRRVTNTNISRALEAFHHLVAAGEADHVQDIAVELLSGNREWAIQRIEHLYSSLFESKAPIPQQRRALEYALILNPANAKFQRFLGECWAKEESRSSSRALECFEKACRLSPEFPANWANLGRTLLAQGGDGARDFLERLRALEEDCPEAIDDHVRAVHSDCLERIGKSEQAAALRMSRIRAGSRDPTFYADEAKARLDAGDTSGALEILDLAADNGSANDFTAAIRADALQQSGRANEAAELRMSKINAGSRNPVFYADEAKARMEAGDLQGALEVLDMAVRNGCANNVTASIRHNILRRRATD